MALNTYILQLRYGAILNPSQCIHTPFQSLFNIDAHISCIQASSMNYHTNYSTVLIPYASGKLYKEDNFMD